jgi:hypothetical protein
MADEDLIPQVVAPEGVTYQWVATDGDPGAKPLLARLANGWSYVDPREHRHILSERGDRIYIHGLVLMQKATTEVEKTREAQRKANDVSFADLVRRHVPMPGGTHNVEAFQRKVKP